MRLHVAAPLLGHGLTLGPAPWFKVDRTALVMGPLGIFGCIAALFTPLLALAQLILHVMCIVKGINGQRLIIPGISDFANKF